MKKPLLILTAILMGLTYFLLKPKTAQVVNPETRESTGSSKSSDLKKALDDIDTDLRELDKDIQFETDLDIDENL